MKPLPPEDRALVLRHADMLRRLANDQAAMERLALSDCPGMAAAIHKLVNRAKGH